MKIDKRIQPLDGIVRYKFTILSFMGVAILGPILNFTLFSISRFDRLFLGIIFMSFAMIMILALTQLFMHVAIQYVNILGRRYKTESTYDPDAAKIAKAMKAPLPKKIVISENPEIDAVTNTLTGTITFSRRLKDLCTRDQFLAVVAHEIGHLKYRKRMILEMLGALGITVLYMILALRILSFVSPAMAELSGLGFFLLLITRIMHTGEFAADKVAFDAGLGQHLADVLAKFGDKYGYNRSSETHPSTGSRIKRLLRPEADLPPLVSGLITTPLKRMFDVNWKINFTLPNRYRLNGVTYHAIDNAISRNKTELVIIDIGCSTGIATKKMKEDLGKKGISCRTIGVDISAVWVIVDTVFSCGLRFKTRSQE
jgi:Zn-dependent protease with chaperone function